MAPGVNSPAHVSWWSESVVEVEAQAQALWLRGGWGTPILGVTVCAGGGVRWNKNMLPDSL